MSNKKKANRTFLLFLCLVCCFGMHLFCSRGGSLKLKTALIIMSILIKTNPHTNTFSVPYRAGVYRIALGCGQKLGLFCFDFCLANCFLISLGFLSLIFVVVVAVVAWRQIPIQIQMQCKCMFHVIRWHFHGHY